MKNLIKRLKRQAQAYIDFHAQPAADINLKTHKIITTIKEAQEKAISAPCYLHKDGSFTGDLVKYDPKNNKLILKTSKRISQQSCYQRYQSFDIGTTNCP